MPTDENGSERGEATGGDDDGSEDGRSDPSEAFAALSDPLRVDILRELSAHHRTNEEDAMGFADLRRGVGVRDSGRFRYHLEELREHFVERIDNGYRLTRAGSRVVAAILAGTYTESVSMGPLELDSDCPLCGGPAVARCEDAVCLVSCPEDHRLFQWTVPPNAAAGATLPEVVDLAQLLAFQAIERALSGVCPRCYADVEPTVAADGATQPVFRSTCDTCGARVVGPVAFPLLVDPAVAAFCRRHGLTLREDHVWEFPFVGDGSGFTLVDEDPVRVECTVSLGDETLTATVDGSGRVEVVDPPGET